MIACESKNNIFDEIRYFLMFCLNFGFTVHWALVLLILSNFFYPIFCQSDIVFRNNRKYLISSNVLIFDSYAIIKLSMQSTLLILPVDVRNL